MANSLCPLLNIRNVKFDNVSYPELRFIQKIRNRSTAGLYKNAAKYCAK